MQWAAGILHHRRPPGLSVFGDLSAYFDQVTVRSTVGFWGSFETGYGFQMMVL